MKASVIMGIYNCEKTLEQALDSLLNQTWQDFSIILCDDGSTDSTYDIASDYRNAHTGKIRLIRNMENKGLAWSLNRCLKRAKGEYIIRMDADDVARSDRLEKQIQFLEDHPEFAMVGSNAALYNEKGVWGVRSTVAFPKKKDFLLSSPFIHPTLIIRKKVLEEAGGYRTCKETMRAEDYDLFMRIYAMEYEGANLQELLIFYREDTGNFTRRAYKYRLDEAKVRYRGFKSLALLPFGYLFVAKPLIVGLFPQRFLQRFRFEKVI